jgi:hypothetical protein
MDEVIETDTSKLILQGLQFQWDMNFQSFVLRDCWRFGD